MKQLILLLLWVVTVVASTAQPQMPSVRMGAMAKGFNSFMAHESYIVSASNNELLMVTHQTRTILAATSSLGLQVVATDTNMNILRQVALPKTLMSKVLATNYVDGKVYVLYQALSPLRIYRAVVDASSMTLEHNETLLEPISGYDVETFPWVAKSQNGLFFALAGGVINTTSKNFLGRQVLLDETFQILWDKQFGNHSLNDVWVDNDGVMYLFGYDYDKASSETAIEVCMLDVNEENRYTARAMLGEVFRLKLLNIVNNKAVAAGYIRTPQSPKNSDCFDKLLGVAFDLNTEELKVDRTTITSDELNVFGNKSTKKPNKEGMVDNLVLVDRTPTNFGGALLIQREWKITTRSTKTPDQHDYYTMGALALAVDTNGKIVWHKPFRTVSHEMTGMAWDLSANMDASLRAQGDNVYVFLPESSRAPQVYDITDAAKTVKVQLQDHACAIYGISREGAVTKQLCQVEDAGCKMDVWYQLAPNRFVSLYANKKKTGLFYVNF